MASLLEKIKNSLIPASYLPTYAMLSDGPDMEFSG